MTGDLSPARKSLMRMRIDRSIVYPATSAAGTQRTSLDSLLGVGCPLRARPVSTIENSCRTSPLDQEDRAFIVRHDHVHRWHKAVRLRCVRIVIEVNPSAHANLQLRSAMSARGYQGPRFGPGR